MGSVLRKREVSAHVDMNAKRYKWGTKMSSMLPTPRTVMRGSKEFRESVRIYDSFLYNKLTRSCIKS
jgi:hypothetical protein